MIYQMQDEHNILFKMAADVSLCQKPSVGDEIVGPFGEEKVWLVTKIQIDSEHVWLTVLYVGE